MRTRKPATSRMDRIWCRIGRPFLSPPCLIRPRPSRNPPDGNDRPYPRVSFRDGLIMIPRATYRLQFHKGFTFQDAGALAPYLKALGVSDIYASPIFTARAGSTHGYDVIDPTRINPE